MLFRCLAFVSVFCGVWLSWPAEARTIYFGSEAEQLPLPQDPPTLFRFPGEVRTISHAERFEIKPANADSPNYALLSVKPRFSRGATEVTFILADGTVIKTKLRVVSKDVPEQTDSIYDFKPKESQLDTTSESKVGASIQELALIRAVIHGDDVEGYEIKNYSRSISPGIQGVSIKLVRAYSGSQFNAYIFEVANTSRQRLFINVANLMLGDPNQALLGSADQDLLEPEGERSKTYLRVVAKPSSIYSELKLPVQVGERK